jgi:uncharacterized protein DUF222
MGITIPERGPDVPCPQALRELSVLSAVRSIFDHMYDDLRRRGSRAPAQEVAARREAIAARLERIADLERQVAGLQAQQVRETAEFIDAQLALDKEVGFSSDPAQHRAMVAEVAAARHVSTISASSYLADAYELATQLPATLAALAAGQVSLGSARTIAQETVVLDRPELRRLADVVIAEEAPTCCRARSRRSPSGG